MNSTRLRVTSVDRTKAWSVLKAEPEEVSIALICSECGFAHLISEHRVGLRGFGGDPIGHFRDHYQGRYIGDWFQILNPRVGGSNRLLCQSCGADARPLIKLY